MNRDNRNGGSPRRRADAVFYIAFAALAVLIIILIAMSSLLTGAVSIIASEIVWPLLFFGIPAVSLAWLVTSLVLFCRAPRGSEERQTRRPSLVRASVVTGIIAAVYGSLILLLMLAVRSM